MLRNSRKASLDGKERRRSQQFFKVDSGNFDEILTLLKLSYQTIFFFFAKPDFQQRLHDISRIREPRTDLRINANS